MSAALFATFVFKVGIASAMGIVCGWHPMPDGSPSYECVVQLEPDVVNSLKHGDSIPLSVEIPEHVRPISRIRITVGKGELPQQLLATNFKPLSSDEKLPRDGVIETQFTTNSSPSGGYGYQQPVNQQSAPVNQYISNTQDAFARSLQNGGQAVQDAVTQAAQEILPPDSASSISSAVDQAGQQLGTNLRSASETVNTEIKQMFGAEPMGTNPEILPPGSGNSAPSQNRQIQTTLPADTASANSARKRLDQPIAQNQQNDWQSSAVPPTSNPLQGNAATEQRSGFNSTWPNNQSPQSSSALSPTNGTQPGSRYGAAPAFSSSNGSILPQDGSSPVNSQQRYATPTTPQGSGLNMADTRSGQPSNNQTVASPGPSFPAFTPSAGNDQLPITPTPQTTVSNSPEIRREMLNQPATAEIQGANGLPIGQQIVANGQAQASAATPSATSFGWDSKPQVPPATTQTVLTSPANPAGPVFPLLLSWVLLSGSGAGNLYLFWSYLDVRNKYRDLVDEASRRISGRRARD